MNAWISHLRIDHIATAGQCTSFRRCKVISQATFPTKMIVDAAVAQILQRRKEEVRKKKA